MQIWKNCNKSLEGIKKQKNDTLLSGPPINFDGGFIIKKHFLYWTNVSEHIWILSKTILFRKKCREQIVSRKLTSNKIWPHKIVLKQIVSRTILLKIIVMFKFNPWQFCSEQIVCQTKFVRSSIFWKTMCRPKLFWRERSFNSKI